MTTSEPGTGAFTGVEIRRATIDDLDALVAIYCASARHHAVLDPDFYRVPDAAPVADRLRAIMERDPRVGAYVVATVGGEVVGSATIAALDRPGPGSMIRDVATAEIGVAVLDAWRGRGVGAALMDHLHRWAAAHGFRRVTVDVSTANAGARRLYERLGYEAHGVLMRRPVE